MISSVDVVHTQSDVLTVFNIGGNKYRLIVDMDYQYKRVFVKAILTHSEYDQGDWKK